MPKKRKTQTAQIKTQSAPDPCLDIISTPQDIQAKIAQVRNVQNSYRDASLYQRKWDPKNVKEFHSSGSTHSLKFLQFNMLAQGLSVGPPSQVPPPFDPSFNRVDSAKTLYGGFTTIPNPEIVLDFDLRQWRLMEVLLEDDFDILTIEEIDRFYGFFEPLMKIMGYEGIFIPKPCSPCVQSGWYSDGCALFWKKDKLELLHADNETYTVGNQVYIIATMRHTATDRILIVAMTHLKAGKHISNELLRRSQVEELLSVLEAKAESLGKGENEIPVILAGDFNSDPGEEKSCIRDIISKDSIYRMRSSYDLDNVECGDSSLSNSKSAMFTTWKTRGESTVKRTIDYIFHNGGIAKGFNCSHTLRIPDEKDIEETRLPGFKYPSDHIAVGAKFELEG